MLMSDIPEYNGEPDYIDSDGQEVFIKDEPSE